MSEKEKIHKLDEYFTKVKLLLGHRLHGYECTFYGDKPVMQIEYMDYKTSAQFRKELQKLMPEVEFATVKRFISDSARLSEIYEYAWCGKDDQGNKILVKTTDGDYITLSDWSEARLYDQDLSNREINYNELELREWSESELYCHLHE